jgi:hypothetical protein
LHFPYAVNKLSELLAVAPLYCSCTFALGISISAGYQQCTSVSATYQQ